MNYINELYKPVARINLTQAGVKFLDTIGEGRKGIEGVEYRRRGGGQRESVGLAAVGRVDFKTKINN